jgi:hypothetical protein
MPPWGVAASGTLTPGPYEPCESNSVRLGFLTSRD